jgi:hypothetical protein
MRNMYYLVIFPYISEIEIFYLMCFGADLDV